MAPKAPQSNKKGADKGKKGGKADVGVELQGIGQEAHVPVWEDGDGNSEAYGDLSITKVEPHMYYVDPDVMDPEASFLDPWLKSWERPGVIFAPFRPTVVRPHVTDDPYTDTRVDEEGATVELSQEERQQRIAAYRAVKPFKNAAPREGPNKGPAPEGRKYQGMDRTPSFMQAFNSAIMTIATVQHHVPPGDYLWELISPQEPIDGVTFPVYNPMGKYVVKLYFQGAWRKVVIDDRLPTDGPGDSLFTATEAKEIWPALLAKAMLKALTPRNQQHLFQDPVWCLMTLMGGWIPQRYDPRTDTASVLKLIRQELMGITSQTRAASPPPEVDKTDSAALAPAQPTSPRDAKAKGGGKGAAVVPERVRVEDMPIPEDPPEWQPEKIVLLATPCDPMHGTCPASKEDFHAVGLEIENGYLVFDAKPFKATTMLRLVSPHVHWAGPYSYNDAQAWTTEAETKLGCKRADRWDNGHDWNDFWIAWEDFVKYFGQVTAFRNITVPKYSTFTLPVTMPQLVEEIDIPADRPPGPLCKYLCMRCPIATQVLLVLTGMQVPNEDGDFVEPDPAYTIYAGQKPEVVLSTYNWKSGQPVSYLTTFSSPIGTTASYLLPIPKGESVYKVEVFGLAPETLFAILAPREFVWTHELDVLQNQLGLSICVDAAEYTAHEPNEWNIWFKKHMHVKSPTQLTIDFSILPPGTDPATVQTGGGGGADKGGKKPPAKGPAKGQTAAVESKSAPVILGGKCLRTFTTEEELEREQIEMELLSHIKLVLLDCDTGGSLTGVINRIPFFTMEPNKNGYMLMAHGITPSAYDSGLWKLQVLSETPVDRIETRAFDSFIMKEGEYIKNPMGQICRYSFMSQEVVYLSAQIDVVDAGMGAPYTVSVTHNDETIFEAVDVLGSCFIPNLWLLPGDKGAQSKYVLQCMLDPAVAAFIQEVHHSIAIDRFRADRASREVVLKQAKEAGVAPPPLRTSPLLDEEPVSAGMKGGKAPAKGGKQDKRQPSPKEGAKKDASGTAASTDSKSWSVKPRDDEILYCVRLHTSSAKLAMETDTALLDQIVALKSKWAGAEPPPAPAAGAKGGKEKPGKGDAAAEQLMAARAARSKEARERFLESMSGLVPTPERAAPEGEADVTQLPLKSMLVQAGARPQIVITEELRQADLDERTARLKRSEEELGEHAGQRESANKELEHLNMWKERQMVTLRKQRSQLLEQQRQRLGAFWTQKHAAEAEAKARAEEEAEALAKVLDDKKAATAKPAAKKK
mmetsp:Transcript_116903/g.203453  ORF Transcript_116903/g.203453 Transcript_116903/m.203453 type:complete len:1257 (-) Transcript_116903:77-3847(-)